MYSYLEYPDITKTSDYNYPPLNLKEGDWIWSDHWMSANRIKKIRINLMDPKLSSVDFEYAERNGLRGGILDFVENKYGGKYRLHRYATANEIMSRQLKDGII